MSSRKRTPEEEAAETGTAVAEPPAAEAEAEAQSFAERVGQKKRISPDPFGIAADNIAGVRLFENRRRRQMGIKFGGGGPEDKPSQEVIDTMKEAGYRWNPADRAWVHPIHAESAMATRIEAERLYQAVRQMIRQEKGIDTGQEVPF
jgi:hypothetical protein